MIFIFLVKNLRILLLFGGCWKGSDVLLAILFGLKLGLTCGALKLSFTAVGNRVNSTGSKIIKSSSLYKWYSNPGNVVTAFSAVHGILRSTHFGKRSDGYKYYFSKKNLEGIGCWDYKEVPHPFLRGDLHFGPSQIAETQSLLLELQYEYSNFDVSVTIPGKEN